MQPVVELLEGVTGGDDRSDVERDLPGSVGVREFDDELDAGALVAVLIQAHVPAGQIAHVEHRRGEVVHVEPTLQRSHGSQTSVSPAT